MRNPAYAAAIAVLTMFTVPCMLLAGTDSGTPHEYRIKAAFLYNFLKFVEWPETKISDSDEPMVISVIGEDVFQNAFDGIEYKTVEGKKVVVKRFDGIGEVHGERQKESPEQYPQIAAIRKSHLLFVCPSESGHVTEILRSLDGYGVLTVADTQHFLESGGIINLLNEDDKVRFEINVAAAEHEGIRIRSNLLRLARGYVR